MKALRLDRWELLCNPDATVKAYARAGLLRISKIGGWPLAVVVLVGCGSGSGGNGSGEVEHRVEAGAGIITDVIEWEREILLEENEDVVNVVPVVFPDDERGGFLVADGQESQFRIYNDDGSLVGFFGRKGDGPGEFRYPAAVVRVAGGQILGVDGGVPRAAIWDSDGDSLLQTLVTPFLRVFDLDVLNDTLLLVAGKTEITSWERLHIWNISSNSIQRSFLTVPLAGKDQGAAFAVSFAMATVVGDTIVATLALSDTVYRFHLDGQLIDRVPIPFQHFRYLEERNTPPRGGAGGRAAISKWFGTFSVVNEPFRGPEGTFLIQYRDRINMQPHWRLLHMTKDGRRLFDIKDTPRLLTTSQDGSELYFVSPDIEVPNLWLIGRMR